MKRIITGLILLGIGGFVLTNSGVYLLLFLGIVGILAFYEIFKFTNQSKLTLIVSSLLYVLFSLYYIFIGFNELTKSVLVLMITIFYLIATFDFYNQSLMYKDNRLFNALRFFLYIYCGFLCVFLIREMTNGIYYISALFLTIWGTDIFAYYGGKRFGAHKLSAISPKKTIEGTCIGFFGAMLIVGIFCYFFALPYFFIIIAGILSLLSQIGDLYESLIKRTYNIKDSSNILPGHGGILDRADSTLYVFPLVFIVLELFIF